MSRADALFANISSLNRRLRIISEQYAAHISELANELAGADRATYAEMRERLAESLLVEAGLAAECNASALGDIFGLIDVILSSTLTSEISEICEGSDCEKESDAVCPLYEKSSSRIVYFRTQGADLAYSIFARALPLPTVEYTHSFSAVCDEVYSGYCDFCILPIYSRQNGRLSTVDRLIRHNSLFISAICDVECTDDTLTFALLSAKPVKLQGASMLDIDYMAGDGYALTSLLCSLSLIGAYPSLCERINDTDEQAYRLVFDLTSENLDKVLSCLDREYPDFSVGGFYTKLP